MNTTTALDILGMRWPRTGKLSCPLHVDKTPSLKLYQDNWYCYSCNENGDSYKLIAIHTGRHINDVLRQYGDKSGLAPLQRATVKVEDPDTSVERVRRQAHNIVFDEVWRVFNGLDTEILIEEIDRMAYLYDEWRQEIALLPPYKRLRAWEEWQQEQMDWLGREERRIWGE